MVQPSQVLNQNSDAPAAAMKLASSARMGRPRQKRPEGIAKSMHWPSSPFCDLSVSVVSAEGQTPTATLHNLRAPDPHPPTMSSTNRELRQRGERLAEAAREARQEAAAGLAGQTGGFGGERLPQETTGASWRAGSAAGRPPCLRCHRRRPRAAAARALMQLPPTAPA